MPGNRTEHGRIRDCVAVLIEGLEARFRDLLRQRALTSVLQNLEELSADLVDSVDKQNEIKSQILEKFSTELHLSFHVLDLNDQQEDFINSLIEKMLNEQQESEDGASAFSARVNQLVSLLSDTMSSLEDPTLPEFTAQENTELF